jgi:hypothetical protein
MGDEGRRVTITLSPAELEAITGYQQQARQLAELKRQGFWRARRSRVTGEVILERAHYDAVAQGRDARPARTPQLHLRAA